MNNEKLNLWVFCYCSCIHESSSFPMSYHKTKKGAIDAMKAHKQIKINEHLEQLKFEDEWSKESGYKPSKKRKFGQHESWSVEKFELEILP